MGKFIDRHVVVVVVVAYDGAEALIIPVGSAIPVCEIITIKCEQINCQ